MTDANDPAFPMAFGEDDQGDTGMNLREYMFTHYVAAFIIARGNEGQETREDITHNAMLFVDASLKALRDKVRAGG